MAIIIKRGRIPKVPHTEFYFKKGHLALEEIHGVYGFSGAYARKMHVRRYPTEQAAAPQNADFDLKADCPEELPLQPFHLRTGRLPYGGDFMRARKPLVAGPTTTVSVAKPEKSTPAG